MKKNMFKISIAFIAAIMAVSSCSDELVKDKIDASNAGNSSKLPSITIGAAENVTYESVDLVASWTTNGDEITESGFIYSTNESFSTIATSLNTDTTGATTMVSSLVVDAEKTYYVKAYAQTKNNGIAYSNVISFTTPVAPKFQDTYLFGEYTAQDKDYETKEPDGDPYKVVIAQKGKSPTKIEIKNMYGGERTIEGEVDPEKKTISVANTNVLFVHSTYGDVFMYGAVIEGEEIKGYAKTTVATYDEEGNIEFAPWFAHCKAGDFGCYTTSLKKNK